MSIAANAMLHEQFNENTVRKSDSLSFDTQFLVFAKGSIELFLKWLLESNKIIKDLSCDNSIAGKAYEFRSYTQGWVSSARFKKALQEQTEALSADASLQQVRFDATVKRTIAGAGFSHSNNLKAIKQHIMISRKPCGTSQNDHLD